MNPYVAPLVGLLQSRKAILVFLTVACLTVLVALGKLPADHLLDYLKLVMPVWLAAQGIEDAAGKWGTGTAQIIADNPTPPATSMTTNVVSVEKKA